MAGTRRFELVEGSSSKFWEVTVADGSYTVTYGRIGTAGVSKTTESATAEADAEKLVREKLKKGYQEAGAAEANWRPPVHVGTEKHIERFLNYKVTGFNPDGDGEADDYGRRELPALRDLDKLVFRVGVTYDDDPNAFVTRLDALLADPRVGDLRALVIGNWFADVCEDPPRELVARLLARGKELRSLEGLFVGDIIQEECEISWLHQMNYSDVLRALPQLREFWVRGGDGLRFLDFQHASLRTLTVQTGGLSKGAVQDIAAARLPELQTLTLWLGSDEYGGDSKVGDLAPILSGDNFPKLEHLGLQNSHYTDAIAVAVAASPILGRLKGLDLSMGTLTDEGARALLAAPAVRGLRHLNLRYHYVSPELVKQLKGLGIEVNTADRQEPDGDYMFAEVTE